MVTEKDLLKEIIEILNSNDQLRNRYSSVIDKFTQQLAQAQLDKYRLGVIGVTSSGKSTMINAIMKKELLSMAVRPSSSQLVSCSKSEKDQVKIYFEDKEPVIETGRNMVSIIQKYSDEKYNPGNSLKVKQLELSTPGFSLPEEVLLVDSPGLDAYGFAGHEKLTMNSLLPTIDFCLFVTTCKTNSDEKMKSVLNTIAEYNCPLIIVQNMIDAIKPSLDGKKDEKQVAEEHKKRIERIVNASAIKDKKNVKIVQVSAKWALDAYTAKLKSEQHKKELLRKSNFEGLIEAIDQVFSQVRPSIEFSRVQRISRELQNIVDNAKTDLKSTEEERKNNVFQYEGCDSQVEELYESTNKGLKDIIQKLENEKLTYQNQSSKFTEKTLSIIKSSVKQSENEIINVSKKFQKEITEYCELFSIDARRLRVIDSFGNAPGLTISTKIVKSRTEKEGFFKGKVARFFGSKFGKDDWGYEITEDEKYDHAKTKKNVQKYYESMLAMYNIACANWEASAQNQVNLLIEQYGLRLREFNNRKEILLSETETENVIKRIEAIIKKIPSAQTKVNGKNIEIKGPDLEVTSQTAISNETLSLIRLSEKILQDISTEVFMQFTGWTTNRETLIVGWDENSVELFLQRNLNIKETNLQQGENEISEQIKCVIKPDRKYFKEEGKRKEGRNVFIVFNTLQYGSALSDLDKSGVINSLKRTDNVCFIVQDFDELITAEGVKEGLQNMWVIKDDLKSKIQYSVMVNHNNPVYNMVLAELQTNDYVTHADEVTLIGEIQQRFPFLRNSDTDKVISDIIESFDRKDK